MVLKYTNDTSPLVWSLTLTYLSTPNPTSSCFRNVDLSVSYTNFLIPRRPCLLSIWNSMPTCTSIQTVSWYWHLLNAPFYLPPPHHFPFLHYSLVVSASIMVSLLLQSMKAAMLAESSVFYLLFLDCLCSMVACRHETVRYRSFLNKFFCLFDLSRFSLYIHFFN